MSGALGSHAALRSRRILQSVAAGLPVLALQISGGLILVTLAWRALGAEGFALWAAITALAPVVALGELGIGNALVSFVASALGREDRDAVRGAALMGVLLLSGVALLLAALLLLSYGTLDFAAWFRLPSDSPYAPALALTSYVACRLVLLPLGVGARLRTGLQENFVNNAWDATGVVLSVLLFLVAWRASAGLPMLLLASGIGPVLAAAGNWVGLAGRGVVPQLRDFDFRLLRPLFQVGALFFALNLSTILSSSVDNLLAIRLLGPGPTAQLAIAAKVFAVGQATLSVAAMPLWPAFADALARRDGRWLRRALRLSLVASAGVGCALAAVFLIGTNRAVTLWLGPDATLPFGLLLACAAWLSLQSLGLVGAMFLNGVGVVRFQVVLALGFGVLAFALKLVAAPTLGVAGIVWATCVAYGLLVLPLYGWFIVRWLARTPWS